MYAAAQERLDQGDLRDAGEKAWCAINRATTGLVAARTGEIPRISTHVSSRFGRLTHQDSRLEGLQRFYFTAQSILHGELFYWGLVEEPEIVQDYINGVADYIEEAQRLTGGDFR